VEFETRGGEPRFRSTCLLDHVLSDHASVASAVTPPESAPVQARESWGGLTPHGLGRQAQSGGQLLLDPSTHEERQADAMLSVAITSAANQVTHLTANGAWPPARLSQVRTAVAEGDTLRASTAPVGLLMMLSQAHAPRSYGCRQWSSAWTGRLSWTRSYANACVPSPPSALPRGLELEGTMGGGGG
jgi:hypothetical protein